MKIIAVDDEHLALRNIERVLTDALPDYIPVCFNLPSTAISFAKENQVDVAFLDVRMGGMNGILLAKTLKDIYDRTNIIFVTGYSEYAMDSYSVNASGYLLKPVSKESVIEAMANLRDPVSIKPNKRMRVQTFGNFEVFVDGVPLHFARKKTKELLAYLVNRQGALSSNNEIISVIWEGKDDYPALQNQFRHLVSDLSRTLNGNDLKDILVKQRGCLAIVPNNIDCDVYDFYRGDSTAVNNYAGEYMAQYSWAELTNAYLEKVVR